MIKDLVLDTHIFTEFIAQYFENSIYTIGLVSEKNVFDEKRVKMINQIITEYRNEETFSNGIIVCSGIGLIEIARKFPEVSKGRYTIDQFKAFLENLPEYIEIANIEKRLLAYLNKVPKAIYFNSELKNVELMDALHCATYFSRDKACLLSDDGRMRQITDIEFA